MRTTRIAFLLPFLVVVLGTVVSCETKLGPPDNCPELSNPDQADSDDDGVGDACDTVDPAAG